MLKINIHKKNKNKLHVNLDNARQVKQRQAMERIQKRQECPFCFENLKKEHKQPILKKGKFWIVTPNQWKYKEAKLHLLLISLSHIESLNEISPEAGTELIKILKWCEKKFSIDSGGVCIRFGNNLYNGATVSHLHAHLLKPYKPSSRNFTPIKFFVGAKKK